MDDLLSGAPELEFKRISPGYTIGRRNPYLRARIPAAINAKLSHIITNLPVSLPILDALLHVLDIFVSCPCPTTPPQQERMAEMTSSISSDYVTPLTHLVKNPSTIHYSTAMSARLSYCMAQQTVVSSIVGGKLTVDPVALSRAVLAAVADGKEEPILEALRVPEGRITSTENYSWWSRNLKGIVSLMK